jgi:hypothetical protein
MRRIFIAAMLACAPPSFAQEPAPGYGPFRLGMNIEQARAALPDAEWTEQVIPNTGGAIALMSRATILLAEARFAPSLEFRDGELTVIRYGRPVSTDDSRVCMTATLQTVRDLEGEGVFDGASSRTEPAGAPMLIHTAAGSVLRAHISSDGIGSTYANRRGALYTEVVGRFDSQRDTRCILMVRISADPNPPPSVPIDTPTAAELEMAPRLETPAVWLERPEGDDFARFYPPDAMRNRREGRATLDCLIKDDGYLRCAVTNEEPAGEGFGEAALQISTRFRIASELENAPTAGKRIGRTIVFRIADDGEGTGGE